MAVRVRDFLRAQGPDGIGEVPALVRLEELLKRGQVLAGKQQSGLAAVRAATMQRAEIRHVVQTKLLPYLVAVGGVAARENLVLATTFRVPYRASHMTFVTAVRNMLEKATAQKDLLLKQGMPPSLPEDLTAGLAEFERTLEASRAGRRDHVGARADLDAISVEVLDQVRVLDGLAKYRFADNAELMAAWFSVRNVLGPFRTKGQPTTSQADAPAGPDVIKPAA
jgi:hypothetical protein